MRPVRLSRKVLIDAICSGVSSRPSWCQPISRIASSSVATLPSWKYGPVIAMLRSDGTLKKYLSASFLVTS